MNSGRRRVASALDGPEVRLLPLDVVAVPRAGATPGFRNMPQRRAIAAIERQKLGGAGRAICRVLCLAASLWTSGCATAPISSPPASIPPPTSATAGTNTIVAIAPPATPQMTLLDFLGVNQVAAGLGRGVACIGGCVQQLFPFFGPSITEMANQPPLRAVNDPENLKSSNPAVKAAAAAAAEEDQAPQKIAALKYLARLGCAGCYPGVEEAILAGLEDCNEGVRFAAAMSVFDSTRRPCHSCRNGSCCTPKLRKKLMQMGYLPDDQTGCPREPSPRVRRAARQALLACGPDDCLEGESPPEPRTEESPEAETEGSAQPS